MPDMWIMLGVFLRIMSDETDDVLVALEDNSHTEDELTETPQTDDAEDADMELIHARLKEMEEEAEKLKRIQNDAEDLMTSIPGQAPASYEEKLEMDSRSIYVGNVDYGATSEELERHFHGCGSINRVSIQFDKFRGQPKGFAYIEFADKDSVSTSIALDESLFRGRQIKVLPKRTNRPGISSTNRPPRGRYRRSAPRSMSYGGYRPMRRSFRRRSYRPY